MGTMGPGARVPSAQNSNVRQVKQGNTDYSTADFIRTGSLPESRCMKNPGHTQFIPVKLFSSTDLPPPFQVDERWAQMIRARAADTVRITAKYTSPRRPDDMVAREFRGLMRPRTGTGTAFWNNLDAAQTPCPCQDCTLGGEGHQVFGPFSVVTVKHLVFDESEAKATTVEFFYDDANDRSSMCVAQVIGIDQGTLESNRSILKCVTHDPRLAERLKKSRQTRDELLEQLKEPEGASLVIMISHPHGVAKHVTVGQLVDLYESGPVKVTADGKLKLRGCTLLYSAASCPGSGGGSVTLWSPGRRAFAPHSTSLGRDRNQSALGWTSIE